MGSIMPAPLAIPQMVISLAPTIPLRMDILGYLSVVIMAASASSMPNSFSPLTSLPIPVSIFFTGSLFPMTPVEQTRRCSSGIFNCLAAAAETASASCIPSLPVAALAQPLLVIIAWAIPLLSLSASIKTGAALKIFFVNIAADFAGTVE
ncbi:MAG: hypothetical protein BWX99_02308 [Deltaproteobacteria bacterium ADurb.Bin151]|nr:MAG: hypothetical protein BWX99_02308 [Deltaproteobacteria bacterium ADurb.Bin151]